VTKKKSTQINFTPASSSEPVFDYVRRFLEISSVVVMLIAAVRIFNSFIGDMGGRTGGMDKWMVMQNQQLVTNMQRVFADTVSSTITDQGMKKIVVFFGICVLPFISSSIREFREAVLVAASSRELSSERLLYLM
jgi:hypothetical protein